MDIKRAIAVQGLEWTKRLMRRKMEKEMIKISEKYRGFVEEIQERCGDIIELEPANKQGSIVAMVCANIIQGFDTKEEMLLVVDMIKVAVEQYWKLNDIPQKNPIMSKIR